MDVFARQYGAIAAINGGFFDPVNQKSTSYITRQGKLVADPHHNERLIKSPDLAPYLEKILNRSEFRRYRCGSGFRYAIARHRDPSPPDCQLIDALGGGPRLLPENTAEQEGFIASANGTLIRDAIGSHQLNARSAIGITDRGDILLVMAAQKPGGTGVSLPDLAAFMKTLGVTQAMNLDGGTSSALYFQNKTLYGKLSEPGNPTRRPVKSVLLVHSMVQSNGSINRKVRSRRVEG
ncbi:phosphodiester glycosidase family protein [Leptothermofonsia sp. ETS-13]|uniref:phosphodiester glycosidase family protein n=1 Tax=Leptothermofonsia sp. ETS-13 TaxID=3035696 RepID=UPI003BA3DD7B